MNIKISVFIIFTLLQGCKQSTEPSKSINKVKDKPLVSGEFTATVRDILPLSEFSGKLTGAPTVFDGFVVILETQKTCSNDTFVKTGERVAFAIHSPALFFGSIGIDSVSAKGRNFKFYSENDCGHENLRIIENYK